MIFKLTQFELRAHFKQIGFWIAALLLAWMTFIVTGQRGSNLLFANSAFAITQTTLFIVPNIIFVVCVLASSTLLRDSQYKMEPLIFATPIDKFEYLTPQMAANQKYSVWFKYNIQILNANDQPIDSWMITGYGEQEAGTFQDDEAFSSAIQIALRDTGANLSIKTQDEIVNIVNSIGWHDDFK